VRIDPRKLRLVNSRISRLAAVLCCSTLTLLSQTHSPAGTITGSVYGPDQKPLAGAIVFIQSRPGPVNPATPVNSTALTRSDGFFILSGVPDGTYSVCPLAPNNNLLPPCSWSPETRVIVKNGNTVEAPPIGFETAVDFHVRVNDPKGVMASAVGKAPGAALFLAVRSPNGRVVPIPMTARDQGGADHHLAVPAGKDLKFIAVSNALSMTNSLGQDVSKPAGSSNSVNVPPGQTKHDEVINIR
jgi:hypothetical protein